MIFVSFLINVVKAAVAQVDCVNPITTRFTHLVLDFIDDRFTVMSEEIATQIISIKNFIGRIYHIMLLIEQVLHLKSLNLHIILFCWFSLVNFRN